MDTEESVYNLIPTPQVNPVKPPIYHSKHPGSINPSQFELGVKSVKPHSTMGKPLGTNADPPTNFTKKHSKEFILPEPTPPTLPKTKVRPPVPTRDEAPILGLKSDKNFIKSNVVEAILSQPKQKKEELPMTMRPGFGEVPVYLKRVKKRIATEKQMMEDYMQTRQPDNNANVTQLSQQDRNELVRHLKTKWGDINTAYQKLSFVLDTPSKKDRKENYEKQLAEIERDIKMLERGEPIFIVND